MFDNWIDGTYSSNEDLTADCWLLEQSDIFDASYYRAAAGISRKVNAAEHYLREGWRLGFEPGRHFEGNFLNPYFRSAGFRGPPAITYLTLRTGGHALYATQSEVEAVAATIRTADLFDADDYAARVEGIGRLDPLLHYVIVGEAMGHAPSKMFDPVSYGQRYADIKSGKINWLYHYIRFGGLEGRLGTRGHFEETLDVSRLNPNRETVLLVVHQASRTGAPILAYNIALRLRQRYNVVALLLAGGELTKDFRDCCAAVIGPLTYADWNPLEMDRIARRILASCRVSYAIVNSIECRLILEPLAAAKVPVVALVHEFSSTVNPPGEMGRVLEWPTQVVFSAEIVAASARADYPDFANRVVHILPQGRVELPPRAPSTRENQLLHEAMRPPGAETALVVLGGGTLIHRKGVDLFLSCEAKVAALAPRRPVRFVWIGAAPDKDYLKSLSKQLKRAVGRGNVAVLDEVSSLEHAYALADVFFLSSRLDPLPNVCIDAALRKMPIVCFENTTGFADLLKANPATQRSVVPHLDVGAAARVIAELADDNRALKELGEATHRIAERTFNMDHYTGHIDRLGREAMVTMHQRAKDFDTIAADPLFDAMYFLGLDSEVAREEAIFSYLTRSAALGRGTYSPGSPRPRRPTAGFHPQVYASQNAGEFDPAVVNPLAHFIRAGMPAGPWRSELITPSTPDAKQSTDKLRVALHGHFFYPELAEDFVRRLNANHSRCDLLLSTSSRFKAWTLRRAAKDYDRGEVVVRIVPNRGRDLAAYLTALAEDLARYDIVGHLHGKRSRHTGTPTLGNAWREFAWQNLLGDLHPMMDTIIGRMAADQKLGLVFASDPHLAHWDANRGVAEDLARRMGIEELLPAFFDFPVGTMFWARTEALKPLFALKLSWSDYPKEPAPYDGSILHAIERLLPFVTLHAGYRYATTYVPGVTW